MAEPLVTAIFKLADGKRVRLEMPADVWELLEQSERQIRSQRRQDRRYLIYTDSIDEIEDAVVTAAQDDVADLLIKMDSYRRLHAAMDKLPKELRRRVYLYYYCGLTIREIARIDKVHHSTVSRSLKQALAALKTHMTE